MRTRGIPTYGLLAALVLAWLVGQHGTRPLAADQAGGLPDLARRVAALEATIGSLQQTNAGQAADIAALKARLNQVEGKLAFVSVQGTEMYITGANLHIRNGLGATNGNPADPSDVTGVVNGLGNVTIGYNGLRGGGGDLRTGSHTLILGDRQNYTSYGGLVAGNSNTISRPVAAITGGFANTASGYGATISAGSFNTASGVYASILGGSFNTASASNSSVSGGNHNRAQADDSSVSGGLNRVAPFLYNWVAGGLFQDD
jgi:hypothetical protein